MRKTFLFLGLSSLILTACKKDVKEPDNTANEQITSVRLTVTKIGSTDTIKAEYKDLDGAGGNAPTFTSLLLKANTHYSVLTEFWNEAVTPAENFNTEINNESNDHRAFYSFKKGFFNPVIGDYDGNTPSLPIGLKSTWHTAQLGNDTVKITLKHMPNGTKKDDITVGSTDAEAMIPIVVAN